MDGHGFVDFREHDPAELLRGCEDGRYVAGGGEI